MSVWLKNLKFKYKISIILITIILNKIFTQKISFKPAVRIVRFQVNYFNANLSLIEDKQKWQILMHKSVLASLRFVNKHWLICGEIETDHNINDCGKLQVTGEETLPSHYQINATFIANRDPIKNVKVDANSTTFIVIQIGLRGGIFQYTNALKVLGKPSLKLNFEDAFFCYDNYKLINKECYPE